MRTGEKTFALPNMPHRSRYTLCRALPNSRADVPPEHDFAYYCDEWLASCRKRLKESTCVKYSTMIELHIKPWLGAYPPLLLNGKVVAAFSEALLYTDSLAPKTVKDILVTLRSILKYTAIYFPNEFPSIDIAYPRDTRKEMRVLSRSEQTVFVQYLLQDIDPCKFGVLLALLTGIRIGELCALRWQQISLSENTIRIAATMQRLKDMDASAPGKTKILIGPPKSDTSTRTIPLTSQAARLCARMYPGQDTAFVLTNRESYMEPRTLQYRLSRYVQDCGLQGVHFHTLRHTFATRCVEVGFEIKTLSEILGHSTTTITLDRYVHSSIELKRRNMEKLAAVGL